MSDANNRLDQLKAHLGETINLNPLDEERLTTSFPVKQLTYFLDGGESVTKLKEKFMLEFERDPIWRLNDIPNLSLSELRERTMQKTRGIISTITTQKLNHFKLKMSLISYVDPGFYTRIGVHLGLFLGALRGQATPKQLVYWMEKGAVAMNGVIGCFAMTELGHGSNVSGVETTAHYDEGTDEFIIHTPTLTATKWWIGGAAHTATHCVVYAQLIVKEKKHGVKCFVVPLRDPKTYNTLTGVVIGDIGKKMGRDGIDNGYIQFNMVRIPRQYMLMKHTQVYRSGRVKEPKLNQLAFGALVGGRVSMVLDSALFSAKALTIAIRYAAVRRQFNSKTKNQKNTSNLETKIIDYQIHQHRLFPLLAITLAIHFTSRMLSKNHDSLMKEMDKHRDNQEQADSTTTNKLLESLNEVHSTSAGLKAFGTWNCLKIIENCRQACGGHGYSSYTGLSTMYQDFAVQCSWEGDNTILTLQLGRYLIKNYLKLKQNKMSHKDIPNGIKYLRHCFDSNNSSSEKCPDLNIDSLIKAWELAAAHSVKVASNVFETELKNSNNNKEVAYEKCSIQRYRAAKCHYQNTLLTQFHLAVQNSPDSLKQILSKICMLFACNSISENSGAFLTGKYLNEEQINEIQKKVSTLCLELRPDIIGLTDAFGFTDYVLNSPLGRFDGNVYKAYFDLVNNLNNRSNGPPSYFKKLIRPLLTTKYNEDKSFDIEIDEEQ